MRHTSTHVSLLAVLAFAGGCAIRANEDPVASSSDGLTSSSETVSTLGSVDPANAFFQPLGTNGRSCGTCHQADQGWSITPAAIQAKFNATDGTDVLFKPHDVAVSPSADVSTVDARRAAYALLLSRGVVRIGIAVPATAEFELSAVDDPYGFASAAQLSLFRRPLPVSNLKFASTVSWDARLTLADKTIAEDLAEQANRANKNHCQTTVNLTPEQAAAIVQFETTTFSAKSNLPFVGDVDADGAQGGAAALATQPFYIGINTEADLAGFQPHSFTIYDAWKGSDNIMRRAIARGAQLFGESRLNLPNGQKGSCSGCHNAPNVGNSSVSGRTFDIGVADASRRAADVPLYTFRNKTTGEERSVTDPGRGLITGKWADIGKFKAPQLRDLDARAPYFHDGSAANLFEVVNHYDGRFGANFSGDEKFALVAFLAAL